MSNVISINKRSNLSVLTDGTSQIMGLLEGRPNSGKPRVRRNDRSAADSRR